MFDLKDSIMLKRLWPPSINTNSLIKLSTILKNKAVKFETFMVTSGHSDVGSNRL